MGRCRIAVDIGDGTWRVVEGDIAPDTVLEVLRLLGRDRTPPPEAQEVKEAYVLREHVRLGRKGYTGKEVAAALGISRRTLSTYKKRAGDDAAPP